MLIIKDEDFIAKGLERACYIHPEDETKVIKIVYSKQGIKIIKMKLNICI
ncbi:YrbL family protein [Aliarcobacter cryaerophilus]|nr:YrbL family protein [Aliarcobacter cryaerophilus]MCT7484316.1 YrbL family protein [Aliarcobacter cryaerophilus]